MLGPERACERDAMVSMAHEILVDLFKQRPSLAAELLAEALAVPLPAYAEARIASVDLTEIKPAEYRADLVVLLLEGEDPVRVIIVEVQLSADARKRFTWPAYLTVSRALHGCPADLLIVAPDSAVAAWAAEPIPIGVPGFVLRPPVLGQRDVPIVTDPAEAAQRPELGVLSVLAHGQTDQGAEIAAAVMPAVERLDDERARFYCDLMYNALSEATRRAAEAKMKGYEYQSEFARKFLAQGERTLLLRQLRARFGELPAAALRCIEAAETAVLERWAERVLTAATLAEVLDDPS